MPETLGRAFAAAAEAALLSDVRKGPVPAHVAIIMDGNRRFARELGLDPLEGHRMGRDTLEAVLDWCLELGIRCLTVYAFSTENFRRNPREVRALLQMFDTEFQKLAKDERVHRNRIRVRVIGRLDRLPRSVRDSIQAAEDATRGYDAYRFNVAVAYGGREEIVEAVRSIARDVAAGRIEPDAITQDLISARLYTADLPDPDLILRTSGEERISNFLLWQLAYAELTFIDVCWPGFRRVDFLRAIREFQRRKRRFGSDDEPKPEPAAPARLAMLPDPGVSGPPPAEPAVPR